MIDEFQRDWDSLFPYVMAAYRSSRHEATQYTPNFLMKGREVRAPVDIVYGSSEASQPGSYDSYADEMQQRMLCAYSFVREHLHEAASRSKRYYDLRVSPQRYQVSDWVYYFNPRKYVGRQEKWSRKFTGPFLVVGVPGPFNVKLQRSRRSKPFYAHVDKVKPYEAEQLPKSWLDEMDSGERAAPGADQTAVKLMGNGSMAAESSADDSEVNPEVTTEAIAGTLPVGECRSPRPRNHAPRPDAAPVTVSFAAASVPAPAAVLAARRHRLRLLFRRVEQRCRFRLLRLLWWR